MSYYSDYDYTTYQWDPIAKKLVKVEKKGSSHKSYSSSWTDRFSSYSYGYTDKSDIERKKKDALNTIGRTVYVLGTKDVYKLRFGSVGFLTRMAIPKIENEDGESLLGNVILFDPSILEKRDLGIATDILCGDALLKTSCRKVLGDQRMKIAQWLETLQDERQKNLFIAFLCMKGMEHIEQETSGFVPYLIARSQYFYTEYYKTSSSEAFPRTLAVEAIVLELSSIGIDFNPGKFQEDVDFAKKLHQNASLDVFNKYETLWAYLEDKYPEETPPESAGNSAMLGNIAGGIGVEEQMFTEASVEKDNLENPTEKRVTLGSTLDIETDIRLTKAQPIRTVSDRNKGLYRSLVSKLQGPISALKEQIEFDSAANQHTYKGLRSGNLDDNALEKLSLGIDTIFERQEEESKPKISISILVDLSGSMWGSKIQSAKEVAISLYEALKEHPQVQIGIYGHSGHYDCQVRRYVTPNEGDASSMASITQEEQNYDGKAIEVVSEDILTWADERNLANYLFVLSDGLPEGYNYYGKAAIDDTKAAVDAAENDGVKAYGIGICHAFSSETGERLYGPGRSVIIGDVHSSTKIISAFITRTLKNI